MACEVRRNTIRQDPDGSIVVTIGLESYRFNLIELNGLCPLPSPETEPLNEPEPE